MFYSKTKQQQLDEYELFGPPHPGEILREDVLPRLGLSKKGLSRKLRTSVSTVGQLLNEKRSISTEMAQKLAGVVGPNALYWLVLQARYDVWVMERHERMAVLSGLRKAKGRFRRASHAVFTDVYLGRTAGRPRNWPNSKVGS